MNIIIWATRYEVFTRAERNWDTPGLQGAQSSLVAYPPPTWAHRRDRALWVGVRQRWGKCQRIRRLVLNPRGVTFDVHLQRRLIGPVLVVAHYGKPSVTEWCRINYRNEMPHWFGNKIRCTAALHDVLDFTRPEWIHLRQRRFYTGFYFLLRIVWFDRCWFRN